MLAVAKHQRYVSNYSGLLLPTYHNWEVAMGKGNSSSVCTCDLHLYIDTSLASGYIKNTNFQELNFWAWLAQVNEEKKSFYFAFFLSENIKMLFTCAGHRKGRTQWQPAAWDHNLK